ncbi:hypothetical protein MNEG_10245 [Monoraphidium neglectum]|uniref:Uncharacterized protein n=1 Tax=Monoraphidium neglectum TaxID=145388 RepID=A0A0D2MTF7_9CHLO|nr:hypothetical protein MNEG_10245 [Monoraphidium neglectum]KIY97715.1 hypothetical protein MNEG_10245 [Monoraphidium neglectum]|eukprot:XP_013896735.1 hypothetical protein MNEG_10245 [Monoraphidium neglectum]
MIKILGELAELAGPLSAVLVTLRDELARACYSNYFAPEFGRPPAAAVAVAGGAARHELTGQGGIEDNPERRIRGALDGLRVADDGGFGGFSGSGGGLAFEQLPWHSVAARLRRENAALRGEQERVGRELGDHQAELVRVEQQLQLFQKAMDAAEEGAAALRAANAALAASEARAASDVAAGAAEARRLAGQVSRLQAELAELREANTALTEAGASSAEALERRAEGLQRALHAAELERAAAVELAAARVAPEEARDLHAAAEDAEARLAAAQQALAAAEARGAAAAEAARALTPRPRWDEPEGPEGRAAAPGGGGGGGGGGSSDDERGVGQQ